MDPESLQKRDRRHGSCLDVFLVVSIMFLFVAVTAGAAGGVMVVMELRSKVDSFPLSVESGRPISSMLKVDPSSSAYKMQNFAYLEATSCEVKTNSMSWAPVPYGTGNSVGSNFDFNQAQHTLKLKQTGIYFMYMDLNLTCTSRCRAGLLTVRLGNNLTCEVKLPEGTTPVSKKCWTVSRMNAETHLLAQMTAPTEGLQNWKLEANSAFGMFLVG